MSKFQVLVEVVFYNEGKNKRKSVPNLTNGTYRPPCSAEFVIPSVVTIKTTLQMPLNAGKLVL